MRENTWYVFWTKNRRLGSLSQSDCTLDELRTLFYFYTIQQDITGTLHLEITGLKPGYTTNARRLNRRIQKGAADRETTQKAHRMGG